MAVPLYDNSSVTQVATVSGSNTQSFTVGANSNRILIAFINNNRASSASLANMAYGGVALTGIDQSSYGGSGVGKWWFGYLIAPATGTNNFTFDTTGGDPSWGLSLFSFYNADQTGIDNANDNSFNGATNYSITLTPIANNCIVVGAVGVRDAGTGIGAFTNTSSTAGMKNSVGTATQSPNGWGAMKSGYSDAIASPASTAVSATTANSTLGAVMAVSIKIATSAFTSALSDSIMNGASRSTTLGRIYSAIRSPADSIMNAASRSTTVSRLAGYSRSTSDSIMNAASRSATLSKGFFRVMSDSIMNAASRLTTVSKITSLGRVMSDSIMSAASRTVDLAGLTGHVKSVSASIMNAASRLTTISKVGAYGRSLSDSIMNAAGRLTLISVIAPFHTIWSKIVVAATTWTIKRTGL